MNLPAYLSQHPAQIVVAASAGAAGVAFALWCLTRAARKLLAGCQAEEVLTVVAATLATSLAASGMWAFFRDVLHLPAWARVLLFSFAEVATIASALRARRAVRDNADHSAGVDGAAMWGFTALSALLSTLDADSIRAGIFRMMVPLAAAWLWERGLAAERRRKTGTSRTVHSKLHLDRILIRLGLAEPVDRTAAEVDAHRRLTRVARAAKHLRTLRAAGIEAGSRRLVRAQNRLDRAMDAAVEHARLSVDPARQQALLAHLTALYHSAELADLTPTSPWQLPDSQTSQARALPAPPDAPDKPPLSDGELVALGYDAARVQDFLTRRGVQLEPGDITRHLPPPPRPKNGIQVPVAPEQVPDRPVNGTAQQVPPPLTVPMRTGSRPEPESGPAVNGTAVNGTAPAVHAPDPVPGPAPDDTDRTAIPTDQTPGADRSGPPAAESAEAAPAEGPAAPSIGTPDPPDAPTVQDTAEPSAEPRPQRARRQPRRSRGTAKPERQAEPSEDELLEQARAADLAYQDQHGRHIPAEKLARALHIRKARATALTQQIRRPALHSVPATSEPPAG
ncbi:hypothetical protein [Actinomadura rupiterrae]|uniref:hypothetical protein n=1 Tax=Actinomadura rupiterrae TaxID=559627 RepID=UPI0020A56DD9|nr:hypothetical protein [Actinomadura rupiterrae]MCP2337890.1 hypothetical protein [Actinomadura rupiterrae]